MDVALTAINVATIGIILFFASNLLVSNFILGTINMFWGFINSLQIVAHIPLLTIIMPGNASVIYDLLYKVATFDLLPIDPILEEIEDSLAEYDNSEDHHHQ